jgi:hypothetical protein
LIEDELRLAVFARDVAERDVEVLRRALICFDGALATGSMRLAVGPGPDIREYRPSPQAFENLDQLAQAAMSFASRLTR